MEFNLADLFERAAGEYPEREAIVANGERRTYALLEERANRLAHHLQDSGVQPGDHVAVYAFNIVEWAEAMLAIYKIRAICINVNFRYVADELAYLLDQAKPVALVFQRQFTDRVAEVAPKVASLRHLIVVEDETAADAYPETAESLGAVRFEDAMAAGSPGRDFGPRSPDDLYLLFTGGTTGLPKGVVWRQEDVIFALGGGIDPTNGERITRPEEMVEKGRNGQMTQFPIAPLMHGATQWGVLQSLAKGHRIVLIDKFDAHGVWEAVEAEKVNVIMITGDAMARPLLESIAQPRDGRERYDLSSMFAISSSAALFSPSLKEEFMERLGVIVSDAIGASESGANGIGVAVKGQTEQQSGITVRAVPDSVVLDDDLNPLPAGVIGRLGRKGNIPLGYLGDPVKTAEVFRTGPDGTRYVVPGDYARLEGDGRITLLGRGSATINSGGEKIFTEEVEGAVKAHPEVYDAIVVGVPHPRWGQTVAVVVQPREGCAPSLDSLQEHCRTKIAGYKVPRVLRIVEQTQRTPTGKPDLQWALAIASAPEE
ncbi:acyl-CoA synthetase [Streptomyces sp. SID3343]|uniref:acyl-CoA synthetase n=1 Tax=Streptomyces sp. SID3343 TaxID=2690260 RepID=UPI00136ACC29|nr:acyl-CoA synthetase [Streptomyces sp. SID3343]MYV99106.1 AMP-binding protein [Streptomyces sp. SID3343]